MARESVSPIARNKSEPEHSKIDMSMMRIAVAGTGGLARLIAHFIQQDTGHHVVLLSREEKPQLSRDYQVTVVDYGSLQSLQFALRGIDTVISTVTGLSQLELIKAAISVRVRRFAPAEFEGLPSMRRPNSTLDRGRSTARQYLETTEHQMQTTSFICGILYERFQPLGLAGSGIGLGSGLSSEGDFVMNCRTMSAQAPAYNANNMPNVTICITAAQDVGKFVTKALDMPQWPPELRMCGQRIEVKDLVGMVQRLRGQDFDPIQWHNPASLRSALELATAQQDRATMLRLHALIATAEGRFDFAQTNLNQLFPDVRTISFQTWFLAKWGTPLSG
ncbi:hypothetical protein LTR27_005990 [Elasticomyces elasticus]|nr:hypothetical protein LTR27_005990 [Elasticomyces elasticus]